MRFSGGTRRFKPIESEVVMLDAFLDLLAQWEPCFPRAASYRRAVKQALGALVLQGRSTVSRIILLTSGAEGHYSADYYLNSRSKWEADELFKPMLRESAALCPGRYLPVALDDTRLKKTGRKIPNVQYGRDPMGPKFHVNLVLGLRYLHAAVLVPLYGVCEAAGTARAIPVAFREAPAIKKPGKRASEEQQQEYRAATKQRNLSTRAIDLLSDLRSAADAEGLAEKVLVAVCDAAFCNSTLLQWTALGDRVVMLARGRKDARLCHSAPKPSRRVYGEKKFTPEDVRKDDSIGWVNARIFHGGCWRELRYKEVRDVLWQTVAGPRVLRLFIVAPTPYRMSKNGNLNFREPAAVFTTDQVGSAEELLRMYFDRWQIEVAHRELKDGVGLGDAQLWAPTSVSRQPALVVAAYAALWLAALKTHGPERTDAYPPLPRWRSQPKRASHNDVLNLLRDEARRNKDKLAELGICLDFDRTLFGKAA